MEVYIGASRGIRRDPSRAGTPLSQSQVRADRCHLFRPRLSYIRIMYRVAGSRPCNTPLVRSLVKLRERIPVKRASLAWKEFYDSPDSSCSPPSNLSRSNGGVWTIPRRAGQLKQSMQIGYAIDRGRSVAWTSPVWISHCRDTIKRMSIVGL